ncbi:cohesin subunit SA-3-like isoform X2 [Zonotrichia albicollis]|uniref:cohesin subunit SA-3-like isoform X2 n=1 Tax=Zonotrichia albicollis TaxID=44394 RepID=UPI003D810FFF
MLGGALLDLVFNDEPETEPEDQEAAESRLEALQGRRSLLAAFCRLLLRGVLELSAAADVFKQYCRFFRDFGDIIRELLRLTRDLDRDAWARTVLLSLQQLFTELLLQEGPALPALPPFRRLRELGRALARLCGLGGTGNRNRNRNRNRAALLALHREGIRFALQPPPGIPGIPGISGISGISGLPGGLPLTLPFLEVLSEFSPRLPRPDRALVLELLDGACRERGPGPGRGFWGGFGRFGGSPALLPPLAERPRPEPPGTPGQESAGGAGPVRLRLRLQLQPVALQPRPHLHGAQEAPPPDQAPPLAPSAQQRLQEDLGVPPDPDGGGGRGGGRGGGGRRGDPKQPREPPGAAPGPFWLLQPRLPDFLKPQFQISLGVFSQFLEFSTQNF